MVSEILFHCHLVPMCLGRMSWQQEEAGYSPQGGQEAESEEGATLGIIMAPSDLLPSAGLHLPKFPEPSKVAPPARDQVFNT
jgi:hypothetical protein